MKRERKAEGSVVGDRREDSSNHTIVFHSKENICRPIRLCYILEMVLTDLTTVVDSNGLLQTCFSELGLYVPL